MDRYIPTESEEQCLLFEWAEMSLAKYPELALLFHVPNGSSKSKFQAVKFKREGLKAGVPDLCLPVARQGYHALYIEMKRTEGGRLSDAQKWWLENLQKQGNKAVVCKGFEEAEYSASIDQRNRTDCPSIPHKLTTETAKIDHPFRADCSLTKSCLSWY
ncbi:MAG: VRR-NUC domain-containing protein, partial [Anaerolineaceae bacterium]|nr:VRR-NUC domain-containing protein [Anaerolineaceae bacterium]